MAPLKKIRLLLLLVGSVLLACCSYMPEQLDPVEWVDSANDWITGGGWGDDASTPEIESRMSKRGTRVGSGTEDPFPSLAEVPDERPSATTLLERQKLAEQLVADRQNANYSDPVEASTSLEPSSQIRPITRNIIPSTETPVVNSMQEIGISPAQSSTDTGRAIASHVANNYVPSEQLPIEPPPVSEFRDWGTVEQQFYSMFQASGGLGSASSNSALVVGDPIARTESYPQPIQTELTHIQVAQAVHAAVIYFGHGSARLSRQDTEVLRQVVAAQKEFGGIVRVVGHASSRTKTNDVMNHKIANYETSLARARSVADELVRLGIPSQNVLFEAVADSQPDYSEATTMGEAANRRANIYIDYQRPPG